MTDLPSTTPHLAKGAYSALMGAACLVAALGAWGAAKVMEGDPTTALLAGVCVAAASVASFLPVIFGSRATNFGVLVLVGSMVRMLALLALALFFFKTRDLPPRPFWIGILAGGGAVLVVETFLAVTMLARLNRNTGPISHPK